jgi:hypothetical protein
LPQTPAPCHGQQMGARDPRKWRDCQPNSAAYPSQTARKGALRASGARSTAESGPAGRWRRAMTVPGAAVGPSQAGPAPLEVAHQPAPSPRRRVPGGLMCRGSVVVAGRPPRVSAWGGSLGPGDQGQPQPRPWAPLLPGQLQRAEQGQADGDHPEGDREHLAHRGSGEGQSGRCGRRRSRCWRCWRRRDLNAEDGWEDGRLRRGADQDTVDAQCGAGSVDSGRRRHRTREIAGHGVICLPERGQDGPDQGRTDVDRDPVDRVGQDREGPGRGVGWSPSPGREPRSTRQPPSRWRRSPCRQRCSAW